MEPFTVHTGKAVPLYLPNIDTDQIVPKKFLLKVERTGYDEALFHEWRYDADGSPARDFVLNDPRYEGASVLITGPNFGCGSSREHAPWAIFEYGFRVIIAPGFADIFYSNCFKSGILPAILPKNIVEELAERASAPSPINLTIDLASQTISTEPGRAYPFEIEPAGKKMLLSGVDEIESTLRHSDLIADFESSRPSPISA